MTRKITVGCAPFPLPAPWENYDLYDHKPEASHAANGKAILKNAFEVDYSGAAMVYAGHFLEHQTPKDAVRWIKLVFAGLKLRGTLIVTIPAFDRCDGPDVPFDLLQAMVSAPDPDKPSPPGIHHRSWWRTRDLRQVIQDAGFVEILEWPDCPYMVAKSHWQVCLSAQ